MKAKVIKPFMTQDGVITVGTILNIPEHLLTQLKGHIEVVPDEGWIPSFCRAHQILKGSCHNYFKPDCLISKIQECRGDLNKLRGFDIGAGVTTDQVIDAWLESNEPSEDIFKNPLWLICMAEHLAIKH